MDVDLSRNYYEKNMKKLTSQASTMIASFHKQRQNKKAAVVRMQVIINND